MYALISYKKSNNNNILRDHRNFNLDKVLVIGKGDRLRHGQKVFDVRLTKELSDNDGLNKLLWALPEKSLLNYRWNGYLEGGSLEKAQEDIGGLRDMISYGDRIAIRESCARLEGTLVDNSYLYDIIDNSIDNENTKNMWKKILGDPTTYVLLNVLMVGDKDRINDDKVIAWFDILYLVSAEDSCNNELVDADVYGDSEEMKKSLGLDDSSFKYLNSSRFLKKRVRDFAKLSLTDDGKGLWFNLQKYKIQFENKSSRFNLPDYQLEPGYRLEFKG